MFCLCCCVCVPEGMKALWDDYTSGSKQRQHLLESRYGRKVLRVTMEEYLSEDWIAFNSKNCPYCFCRIQVSIYSPASTRWRTKTWTHEHRQEWHNVACLCFFLTVLDHLCSYIVLCFVLQKDRGCNMMTCSQCRRLFCWACLTKLSTLNAGAHFQDSPCSLHQYYAT